MSDRNQRPWWAKDRAAAASDRPRFRAVAYYRHLARDRQENSVLIQQELVRKWAKENEVEVIHEFADRGKLGLTAEGRDGFTHADAGQMHLYCNYAAAHWTNSGENPPVGLVLCAQKDSAVARYALEGLPNKVMATQYKTTLPDEALLVTELEKTRQILESRRTAKG